MLSSPWFYVGMVWGAVFVYCYFWIKQEVEANRKDTKLMEQANRELEEVIKERERHGYNSWK